MSQNAQPEKALTNVTAPSHWTAGHIRAINSDSIETAPAFGPDDFSAVGNKIDIWDAWPVQDADGHPSLISHDEVLWMALAAPRFDDPEERHGHARIYLLLRKGKEWINLGPLMPDGFSPGSREWSGSAVLGADRRTLVLYFTATGLRGESVITFTQRMFSTRATLVKDDTGYHFENWRDLTEVIPLKPDWYMPSDAGNGKIGTIKAFRDPGYFFDPATGRHYLFFAASKAFSHSAFNGVVGAAFCDDPSRDEWHVMPPLVSADELNNELERPHVVLHKGLYYLFWSTQAHVFNPEGPTGPTGLYGMVASALTGDWKPVNGSGLVFANPLDAPKQAYSWLVMPDLKVTSFADQWGPVELADGERRFGGTFAPDIQLWLDGDRAGLIK
ncbi:glycoside hydrolase family 68 protein [Altererythrobacter indicus]|uniref:Glycoside hydrolase family 68 protein n=1 Tax=Altericroceibacterium indicum TaxID=374177 RepID=A0A845ABH2_9SPHN|nr:glycoside hydrolase family 68 protein [Altericroceibacterium indicum]MXP26719.1 glycoside hydrolase family 68 protein [Altericroceibacterium indicum]